MQWVMFVSYVIFIGFGGNEVTKGPAFRAPSFSWLTFMEKPPSDPPPSGMGATALLFFPLLIGDALSCCWCCNLSSLERA